MQRRSATVYVVLFLVVAAGAYSLIGVAQQPDIEVDGEAYAQNDTLTVNDREYTVDSVSEGEGALTWTNESARHTETWENNTTVELEDNSTFRVLIPNESDPNDVTLQQEFELGDDVTTVEEDGTTYVVTGEGDNRSLVPVEEYKRQEFGEPETREYTEGDTFDHRGNETTVNNVTVESAELVWTAPQTNDVPMSEGDEVTLGPDGNNETYVAHFEQRNVDGEQQPVVVLSQDVQGYQNQVAEINDFNERIAGLWGVVIISVITVLMLIAFAFLPPK